MSNIDQRKCIYHLSKHFNNKNIHRTLVQHLPAIVGEEVGATVGDDVGAYVWGIYNEDMLTVSTMGLEVTKGIAVLRLLI
jgi:hypothetical protein